MCRGFCRDVLKFDLRLLIPRRFLRSETARNFGLEIEGCDDLTDPVDVASETPWT